MMEKTCKNCHFLQLRHIQYDKGKDLYWFPCERTGRPTCFDNFCDHWKLKEYTYDYYKRATGMGRSFY